ncbi:MAG: hypothetical protein FWD73_16935 [Polyangiaceae bacterium]|nr:hypothetical protein [Polyangiaceae bacterium]
MAIGLTLHLEKEVLDEEMVLKGIHDLGFTSTVETPTEEPVFHCNSCYDTLGFQVNLVKSMGPPTNVLDIRILTGEYVEFEFRQYLSFRFNYEFEASSCFERAIKMIVGIMNRVHIRGYVDRETSAEVCFFNDDKNVYINRESGVWGHIDVTKEFSNWKVIEVAM